MKRYVKEFATDMMKSLPNTAACYAIREAVERALFTCERGRITEHECIRYILKVLDGEEKA